MSASLLERAVRAVGRDALLASLSPAERAALRYVWEAWARPEQLAPPGNWRTWLNMAGRGAGKTRAGAEWVRGRVRSGQGRRIALVAKTPADARDVMVEGESGILAVTPDRDKPTYEPSKRRLTWPNGAMALIYTSYEPDQLRGPQFDTAWADEAGAWKYPTETWDNLQLCMRLGEDPRQVVTTTPRPVKVLRDLLQDPNTVVTRGSTYDNRAHLAPAFLDQIIRRYEGTRLGRQELLGELLDDVEGALWTRAMFDPHRRPQAPDLPRIVVGVDPAASSGEDSDETGIVVAGRGVDRRGYVLGDLSCRLSPDGWARRAVQAYQRFKADCIVAEKNQGGEMVGYTIRTVAQAMGISVPVKLVHAARGKRPRAEPIAALYEQGRVSHVGAFPDLEDQCCSWVPDEADSPDRMDACLVAGTLVTTSDGGIPIEQVQQGDYVLTRQGWRLVRRAVLTDHAARVFTVEMSDGRSLTGTGNHPVWIDGRGFTPLDALVWGDIITTCETETKSPSTALSTRGILTRLIGRTASTILPHAEAAKRRIIGKFGRPTTGLSRVATTSTTKTRTRSTTTLTISSACLQRSMSPSTPATRAYCVGRPLGEGIWRRSAPSRQNGTDRMRGLLGTGSVPNSHGGDVNLFLSPVPIAKRRRNGSSWGARMCGIAAADAPARSRTPSIAMRSPSNAPFVAPPSSGASTRPSLRLAHASVVRLYESGVAPVYNLEVADVHEYFANGVLVHNCVWALSDLLLGSAWGVRV